MQRLVEYADELVTSVGPRPSASDAESGAADLIAANLEDLGLDTWIQDFNCAQNTRWVRIVYCLLGFFAAELLFAIPAMAPLSFVIALVVLVLLALDLLGRNPLTRLFSNNKSQNVVARYVPEGADPRRKVVVVAHYDSARSMVQCAPPIASFSLIYRTIIRVCIAALPLVALLMLFPFPEVVLIFLTIIGLVIGIILLVAAIVEAVNLFMPHTKGANCNASGVAAMMGVAETLVGVRSDAGLDTGGRSLEEFAPRPRTERAPRREGRSSQAVRAEKTTETGEEEGADTSTTRSRSTSKAGLGGIGGAAGALFTRAKGAVSKRSAVGEENYHPEESGAVQDDYVEVSASQRLRSGKPQKRKPQPVDLGGRAPSATESRTAFDTYEAEQAEAGLGMTTTPDYAHEGGQARSQTRSSQQEGVPPNMPAVRGIPTENPAIRTRPPLAEQQESDRALQREAQERALSESGRSEDGTPAWFTNAKKAAHNDTKQRAAEAEPKVARSKFADVPVEYTPEAAKKAESAAQQRPTVQPESAAQSETAVPSKTAVSQSAAQEPRKTVPQGSDNRPLTERAAVAPEGAAKSSPESAAVSAETAASQGEPRTQAASESTQAARRAGADAREARIEDQETGTRGSDAQGAGRQQARADAQDARAEARGAGTRLAANPQEVSEEPVEEYSASDVPPTTLNADFTGLDHLASDPPTASVARTRLPDSASSLEQAAAMPSPEIPENDKLRNLPSLSLGNSGSIPTQQAGFDHRPLFDEDDPSSGTNKVSNTGSFAPLGATGIMKPVGEELLDYHQGDEQDIYLDDADESDTGSLANREHPGSSYAPNLAEMPKSRAKNFFGNLGSRLSGGRNKTEHLDSTPSSWIGVDEDFDARTEGSQIGGWDNFSEEDDDDWKGGAYGGESYEEDAEALKRFSSVLIDKEVWFVALGAHESDNAGLKALLANHERELRSALFINIDGVGAGDLCYTMAEGTFRPRGTDHRLQGLIRSAADALGLDFAPTGLRGYNSDGVAAMRLGARAISLVGLDKQLPVSWHWKDDRLDILDEDNLDAVADVVVEVIKSI